MGKLAAILVDAQEMFVEDLGPGEIHLALLALDALPRVAAAVSGRTGAFPLHFGTGGLERPPQCRLLRCGTGSEAGVRLEGVAKILFGRLLESIIGHCRALLG